MSGSKANLTTWKEGQSGNPAGRPPTTKQNILTLKQKVEHVIRSKVSQDTIVEMVEKMAKAAANGDIKAGAALLPYFLSKPGIEKEAESGQQIVIRIENATFKAQQDTPVIDATFEEEKTNG
jgi:hypothetical protein